MKKHTKIILASVFLIIIVIGICYAVFNDRNAVPYPVVYDEPIADTSSYENGSEMTVDESETSLKELELSINDYIQDKEGKWAIYVENLSDGSNLEINNCKMVSASLIKLFIMANVYAEVEKGNILIEDVKADLHNMITVSDNEASNVLVAKLGGGKYTDMYDIYFQNGIKQINEYAANIQCYDTEQQRDMKNSRPNPISEQNYTSVSDCGKLLSRLYRQELVSPSADCEMLELLKQQTRKNKIPSGLPDGVICANKTGELSDVENDVAIVFSPNVDYILCIMSNDVPNTANARGCIVGISELVYSYFNK